MYKRANTAKWSWKDLTLTRLPHFLGLWPFPSWVGLGTRLPVQLYGYGFSLSS